MIIITLLVLQIANEVAFSLECHETFFSIGDNKFNVNHLKDHRPPAQSYNDKSNIIGGTSGDNNKEYVFFNIADVVNSQSVDKLKIGTKCSPRTEGAAATTTTPMACILETNAPKNSCPDGKSCWVALGSCRNVTYSLINENDASKGINLLYKAGDYNKNSFLVTVNCCTGDACLVKAGLDSPVSYKTSSCELGATHCVEFSSPFGCDCDTRATLDQKLGKKEFHCDAIPKGLSSGTSTGTLLLIFFIVIVGLYLSIGMGYNYSEGRRGQEMIPHLEMWKDLGGLIYDGFMFVKSCGEYREGVQYDAIG